jgi:hypothetical protein
MARRRVFTVSTPLGYRVTLTRERWRTIIRFKHPALAGHGQDVQECLRAPRVIRESAKDPYVHLYYAASGRMYVCVVVAPAGGADRFVVTAYFTREIKEGRELWTA